VRHPVSLYGEGLIAGGETEYWLRLGDGRTVLLALERYLAPADDVDRGLLAELEGPVLDVGCGPGRHLHALAARGVFALGVDLSPVAVRLANGRGARAIVASIFDELPGSGAWRSALLLDGNIGIGGQPRRLLGRLARLLADGGTLLVELSPPDAPTASAQVRIERSDGRASRWFSWAWVSVSDAPVLASTAGFVTQHAWTAQGRWFAELAVERDVAVAARPGEAIRASALGVEVGELARDRSQRSGERVVEHPALNRHSAATRGNDP
jgi:SAM-dependent methyltransferase